MIRSIDGEEDQALSIHWKLPREVLLSGVEEECHAEYEKLQFHLIDKAYKEGRVVLKDFGEK